MSNSSLLNLYSNVIRYELTLDDLNVLNFPISHETLKKIRNIYLNSQIVFSMDLQRSSGMSWVGRQVFSLSRRVYALFCEKTVVDMTLKLLNGVQVDCINQEKKIKSDLLAKLKLDTPDPWLSEEEIAQKIDEVQASIRKNGDDIDESLVEDDFSSRIKEVIIQKLSKAYLPTQLFKRVFDQSDQAENPKIDPLIWARFNVIVSYLIEARKTLIGHYLAQERVIFSPDIQEKANSYADKIIQVVVSNIKPNDSLESIKKELDRQVDKNTEEAFKVLNGKVRLSSDGFFDEEATAEINDQSEKIKRSVFAKSRLCDPFDVGAIDTAVKKINLELIQVIEKAKRNAHLRFCEKVFNSIKESHKPFLDEYRAKGILLPDYEKELNALKYKLENLSLESVKEILETVDTMYKLLSVHVEKALGEEEEKNKKVFQTSLSILTSLITKIIENGNVTKQELDQIIKTSEVADFSETFFDDLKQFVFDIFNTNTKEFESQKPIVLNKFTLLVTKFNSLKNFDINSKQSATFEDVLTLAFDIGEILLELKNKNNQQSAKILFKLKENLVSLDGIFLDNQMRQLRLKSLHELYSKLLSLPRPEWSLQTSSQVKIASSEYVPAVIEAPKETSVKPATWSDLKYSQTAPLYLFNLKFLEESEIPEFSERMSHFHQDREGAKKEYARLLSEICSKIHYPNVVFVEEFWSYTLPKLPELIKVLQQPQVPNLLHLYSVMNPAVALFAYSGWLLTHQDRIGSLNLNSPIQITNNLNKLSRDQDALKNLKEWHAIIYEVLSSMAFNKFKSILEGGLTGQIAFKAAEIYFGIELVGTQENKFLQLGQAAIDKFVNHPLGKYVLKYFLCIGKAATERHKIQDILSFIKPLENFSKAMSEAIIEKEGVYTIKSKDEIVKTLPILLKSIADILSKILADGSSNMREARLFKAIQNSVLTFKQDPNNNDYFAQGIHQFVTSVIDETLEYNGHFKNKEFVMMPVTFLPEDEIFTESEVT